MYENRKNREYFILKGGVSLTAKFIDKNLPIFYQHKSLIKACCAVLGNMAITNDNQILLWVIGAIPNIINLVDDLTKIPENEEPPPGQVIAAEYSLFALWMASIDCPDVQDELMKRNFIDMALVIIHRHSNNINLIAFTIAIIRRLGQNSKYKDLIAKNFLYTLITFLKLFYES